MPDWPTPSQTPQKPRPHPLNSLTAAATRLTSKSMKARKGFSGQEAWQEDAWAMYDLVGEQRFLATTLANRLSQARFYVGKRPANALDDPDPVEETDPAYEVFDKFAGNVTSRAQLVQRLGVNLFVAGDGWLAGIPRHRMPEGTTPFDTDPHGFEDYEDALNVPLEQLEWRMLSVSEVTTSSRDSEGTITLKLGESSDQWLTISADEVLLIRVWRPHPRYMAQVDSPTRSSLGVLRELVGLTMHISAQIDSRLAGAGVLVVPASAKRAIALAAGMDPDEDGDPFTDALMEAMLTPISDRSNASAMVPLVVTVPDDATGLFQHLTFANNLDSEARPLREEAIRRLALGQDCPPELLLGSAGMNHWGAWLVREDVVTTHIEPPLALISDALTTQYLWPVLEQLGIEDFRDYVVWYDISHMIQRPNRLQDAILLFDKGVISDEALRDAGGFDESDAPDTSNPAIEFILDIVRANPGLLRQDLAPLVEKIDALMKGESAPTTVQDQQDINEALTEVKAPVTPPAGGTPAPGAAAPAAGPAQEGGAPASEGITASAAQAPMAVENESVASAAMAAADAAVDKIFAEVPELAMLGFQMEPADEELIKLVTGESSKLEVMQKHFADPELPAKIVQMKNEATQRYAEQLKQQVARQPSTLEFLAALIASGQQKQPVMNFSVPEGAFQVHVDAPPTQYMPAPEITVNVAPSEPSPILVRNEVNPTPVDVHVEPAVPVIEVQASPVDVKVDVAAPEINLPEITVESPTVNVEAPAITVAAPEVKVDVAVPEIKVPAPQIDVKVPEIKMPEFPEIKIPDIVIPEIKPEVNVTIEEAPRATKKKIIRDAQGNITGVEES